MHANDEVRREKGIRLGNKDMKVTDNKSVTEGLTSHYTRYSKGIAALSHLRNVEQLAELDVGRNREVWGFRLETREA